MQAARLSLYLTLFGSLALATNLVAGEAPALPPSLQSGVEVPEEAMRP